jgi:predicted amidohydrolase
MRGRKNIRFTLAVLLGLACGLTAIAFPDSAGLPERARSSRPTSRGTTSQPHGAPATRADSVTTSPVGPTQAPATPGKVLVAAVQCGSAFGDPQANRLKLANLVRQAAHRGARIVVLPETAVTGYLTPDLKKTWQVPGRQVNQPLVGVDPKDAAETVPGPSTEFFGLLAGELGIYLTVPLLEADRKTGAYYNTSVLLGPSGEILIHYRKLDPWPWAERGWATPGDRGNPVVDTPWGRLGLLICYDIHRQAEVMGRLKVDILLYSIAWVEDAGSDWFARRLPAIAKANGLHIVGANWTVSPEPAPTWHGFGQSRIITADGEILAKAANDLAEEIVFASLPLSAVEAHSDPTGRRGSETAPSRAHEAP